MLKLGGWGIVLTILFSLWCMSASDPHDRFDRACKPVEWTGNLFTSMTLLVWDDFAETMNDSWERIDYGCEYTIWRLFFEKEYIEYQIEQGNLDENGNPIIPEEGQE